MVPAGCCGGLSYRPGLERARQLRGEQLVPPEWIEHSTLPLPRVRSTTELWRLETARNLPDRHERRSAEFTAPLAVLRPLALQLLNRPHDSPPGAGWGRAA